MANDIYSSSVYLKVVNGTTKASGENLCATCRNHFHSVEAETGAEKHLCTALERPMKLNGPIAICNFYRDTRQPSLHSMEDMAWEVRTDKIGATVGFMPPKKDKAF